MFKYKLTKIKCFNKINNYNNYFYKNIYQKSYDLKI